MACQAQTLSCRGDHPVHSFILTPIKIAQILTITPVRIWAACGWGPGDISCLQDKSSWRDAVEAAYGVPHPYGLPAPQNTACSCPRAWQSMSKERRPPYDQPLNALWFSWLSATLGNISMHGIWSLLFQLLDSWRYQKRFLKQQPLLPWPMERSHLPVWLRLIALVMY